MLILTSCSNVVGAEAENDADASSTSGQPAPSTPSDDQPGIWIDADEVAALPTSGTAWEAVRFLAESDWDDPDLDDGNSDHDVQVLAGALYAVRTGDPAMRQKVKTALTGLTRARPTMVLPLGRNLIGYVVAADLIDHGTPDFRWWLFSLLDLETDGRAGIKSLRESAMTDPSNHGTHARASVLAVALFLDDEPLQESMAERFHDWLGRSGDGFVWKELDWQADQDNPVGVNPPGSMIGNLSVNGVLPEEQRRSGPFTDPPNKEGYVWEALQGAVSTAEMLDRAGYPAWQWQDRALLRAFNWLYEVNDYPAEGDDVWQVWLVNRAYGTSFAATESPTRPGKNLGFTDWTHATPPASD